MLGEGCGCVHDVFYRQQHGWGLHLLQQRTRHFSGTQPILWQWEQLLTQIARREHRAHPLLIHTFVCTSAPGVLLLKFTGTGRVLPLYPKAKCCSRELFPAGCCPVTGGGGSLVLLPKLEGALAASKSCSLGPSSVEDAAGMAAKARRQI